MKTGTKDKKAAEKVVVTNTAIPPEPPKVPEGAVIYNVALKTGDGFPKYPREGTKRDIVIKALRDGKKAEDIRLLFAGWKMRHVRECWRILHNQYGFGFKTDPLTGITKILEK